MGRCVISPPVPGLAQSLVWDGTDDYGQQARGAPFRVRVRLGLGAQLEAIAGGDPYALWTDQSGQGDPAQWRVTGLDAKPDGSVFLLANNTPYGLPTLRRYDARGNYRRTLFPPPAGKPVDEVRGWGVNMRADGTYTLQANTGWASMMSQWTLLSGGGLTSVAGAFRPTTSATFLSSGDFRSNLPGPASV